MTARQPHPQPYDMSKPEDRARWFREMKGYLSLTGEDNFLIQGTDRSGRRFAWEAFLSIEREFTNSSSPAPVPEQTNGGDPWNCTDLGIECPDPEQEWCDWPCDNWLKYHNTAVAEAARREVLDAIREWTKGNSETIEADDGTLEDAVFLGDLLAKLESLRSGEGGQRE